MEKRLGKGLGALISEEVSKSKEKVARISLKDIVPNPFQPRKRFEEEKMEELISSVKEKGVIQPILVREKEGKYEIIAGERRWRAASQLNEEDIPAIIREDVDDANSLEISIIENIQREELNPVEQAVAYQELIKNFGYTLEKVGQMMAKDKTTISNSLRILALSEKIKQLMEKGVVSTGHAKALLSVISEQKREKITDLIVRQGISVRETEAIVKRLNEPTIKKNKKIKNPEIAKIEEEMQHKLGTKVSILQGKKRGKIEIQYFSHKDLERLLRLILK